MEMAQEHGDGSGDWGRGCILLPGKAKSQGFVFYSDVEGNLWG